MWGVVFTACAFYFCAATTGLPSLAKMKDSDALKLKEEN
jgi:hypothetical protein